MKLLEPIKIGNTVFKNRVMFPPLTTGYEERDGSIGERSFNFYKRLAEGGVGYIVIGDVAPVNTASPTPKLFDDRQIPTFARLADALHEFDAKLGLQIFHPEYDVPGVGRMIVASMTALKEAEEAKAKGDMATFGAKMQEAGKIRTDAFAKLHHDMMHFINEASIEQLQQIIVAMGNCAAKAVKAGVDVIEIHGDRIVGSLSSTILNKRTDIYGGSFENRIRFAIEVVRAIKNAAPNITIDYKLPIVTKQKDGSLMGKGGVILEEAIELAKILEAEGVHTIHVAQANHTGNMNDTIPAMGTRDYSFMREECIAIKNVVSIPVSIVGRVIDVDMAEELINSGVCDFVGFGRPLLADPDIVNKTEAGLKHLIRKCICCNKGCTDNIQNRKGLECVLNPENGSEYKRVITPTETSKKVAIVGGGVAGLEAARVCAIRGHIPTVYEKSDKLYGQINIASVPPRKDEMLRICKYYDEVIKHYNIDIKLNTEFTKASAEGYDEVIVAIGAVNAHPPIKGIENTIDSWDVLAGLEPQKGHILVAGGGLVGVETAEYLVERGYSVSIIEMQDKIAKEESSTILPTIMASFNAHGVKSYTYHRILEFTSNSVICEVIDKDNNVLDTVTISGDAVVNALASKKLRIDLDGVANVYYVGDCKEGSPCNIDNATKTAYDIANSI